MNLKIFKILLIEDNPGDARLIEELLKESGLQFKLECASKLTAGIDLIKSNGFDVILLDLGLPDSQGLVTLSKLNDIELQAPIIVITGMKDDDTSIEAVKKGAQDYLLKGQITDALLLRSINYAVERKKLEVELHDSEEKFKTVADYTYEWEYWLDPGQHFVYISPSAERISGYRPEEFIADAGLLYRIVHADDKALYEQHMSNHFKEPFTDKIDEIEFRIIARNNEVRWMHHICRSVFNTEKKFLGKRVSNHDITTRKRVEEELVKHREHLEELVKERTEELNVKNEELERFNKLFVGREMRIIELKKIIGELKQKNEELNKKIRSLENTKVR